MMARPATPRRRPRTGIDPDSTAGRIQLALRAGPASVTELTERFGRSIISHAVTSLIGSGLVERRGTDNQNAVFHITDAGRAACPLRNPLAGKSAPVPAGATGGRIRTSYPREAALNPAPLAGDRALSRLPSHIPVFQPRAPQEETPTMPPKPIAISSRSPITVARDAIARAVSGLTREESIDKKTLLDLASRDLPDIDRGTLENSLRKMVSEGQRIAALGATSARRYFDPAAKGWEPEAAAEPAAGAAEITAEPPPAAQKAVAAPPEPPPVEFAIYSDGRMAIIDGDEIFLLRPADTRRLVDFLGCFEAPLAPLASLDQAA